MINDNVKIIAVIVTYNRLELLKECIKAILNSTVLVDILVVNNNSTDGTKEYLNDISKGELKSKFYIYNLNENINGAGGFNYGIKSAIELNYKYIYILDDDCIVNNDSIEKLLDVANELKDDFGFLSSKVLWKDNTICKTNVQRRKVARKIKDFSTRLVKVDFCSFVSCFVKSEDVKKVGLPIKDFIIWTDDLEWTRRLTYRKIYKNAKCGYLCNESVVIHKCANNFGVTIVKDTDDRFYRYKYIYRNDVYCFKREGIRGHIFLFVRNIYHIVKIMLFAKTKKLERVKVLLKGYIDGYKFKPEIEFIK